MELPGDGTDASRQRGLEVEMDVLEGRVPGETVGFDIGDQRLEAVDQLDPLVIGQQPRPAETSDVGDRARQVVEREGAVDLDGTGEIRDPRVVLRAEPPAPEPHRPSAWCGPG